MFVRLKQTYTTVLSSSEVKRAVEEMLDTKSKFLLFSIKTLYGSVKGREFTVTVNSGNRVGVFLMSPKIRGTIIGENPTTVDVRIVIPYFLIFLYLTFGAAFIAMAFVNEMTINGVLREPELLERLAFVFSGLAFPSVALYFSTLRPIKILEGRVKEKLLLVPIR